jgi:hypothetical protein
MAGSGAWRADDIEAAHAKVPGRRGDESRLMKPAPCGGHRDASNLPAFPRWSRRLKIRLGPVMGTAGGMTWRRRRNRTDASEHIG